MTAANLAFGFLAGSLSTLSPCVLPLLPVLLGSAVRQHRFAPMALAAGLALSFTTVGLFVATLGFAVDIDGASIRSIAAGLMAAFGAVLASARLQRLFARLAGPLSGGANGVLARMSGEGLAGQFTLGALLGAAWSPCAGPTLGAAIGLAAQSGGVLQAAAVMAVFSLGAAAPMMALAYGSREALSRRRADLSALAERTKPILGLALLLTGLFIFSGLDKVVETHLTNAMPPWLIALTTRF